MKLAFTLAEFQRRLEMENFGEDCTGNLNPFGVSTFVLVKQGSVRATWKSQLQKMPPIDGVTPRGPSLYYDLAFYPPNGT